MEKCTNYIVTYIVPFRPSTIPLAVVAVSLCPILVSSGQSLTVYSYWSLIRFNHDNHAQI